ncbi:MAG: hypothetical protein LBL77_00420 [Endomicrobium sp.]|nr:hypothetical protein [Endomicrobium sp.]
MVLIIDLFLVISVILIGWLGWFTGFTRAFFAAFAGFMSVFAASKYPYQEGLNFYIVFLITALFIIILGVFTLRVINFFYLNILDKFGGMVLSVFIWLVISVNIIIPTITGVRVLCDSKYKIHSYISNIMQSKISIFKNYISELVVGKTRMRQREIIFCKKGKNKW